MKSHLLLRRREERKERKEEEERRGKEKAKEVGVVVDRQKKWPSADAGSAGRGRGIQWSEMQLAA